MTKITKTLLAASLLAAATPIFAAVQTGSLGNDSSATDFYLITCPDATTYQLNFNIMDTLANSAPIVSGQVSKGFAALSTNDLTDTDKLYGPAINVIGGAGNYLLTVDKNAAGVENYSFNYTCKTTAGVATRKAATITNLQNQ